VARRQIEQGLLEHDHARVPIDDLFRRLAAAFELQHIERHVRVVRARLALTEPVARQVGRDPEQEAADLAVQVTEVVELQHPDVSLLHDFLGVLGAMEQTGQVLQQRRAMRSEQTLNHVGPGRHRGFCTPGGPGIRDQSQIEVAAGHYIYKYGPQPPLSTKINALAARAPPSGGRAAGSRTGAIGPWPRPSSRGPELPAASGT